MKVLILGGTGAMGRPLAKRLVEKGHEVYVTTRKNLKDTIGIKHIRGNAKEIDFISQLLSSNKFDCIVDFMSYSTQEFKQRYNILLNSTGQYVFISSARIFSPSEVALTEESSTYLDTSTDQEYLKTDEYALSKARQERLLKKSGRNNWTIVRPSLTYNSHRLQLEAWEKEEWLWRVVKHKKIVLSKDLIDVLTPFTHGDDVAEAISCIIGEKEAIGKSFNIASEESYKWSEILEIYKKAIENKAGVKIDVVYSKESLKLKDKRFKYQVMYSRRVNRKFNCSSIKRFCDISKFKSTESGITEAVNKFFEDMSFGHIDFRYMAWCDIVAREWLTPSEIPGLRSKIAYYTNRLKMGWIWDITKRLINK